MSSSSGVHALCYCHVMHVDDCVQCRCKGREYRGATTPRDNTVDRQHAIAHAALAVPLAEPLAAPLVLLLTVLPAPLASNADMRSPYASDRRT